MPGLARCSSPAISPRCPRPMRRVPATTAFRPRSSLQLPSSRSERSWSWATECAVAALRRSPAISTTSSRRRAFHRGLGADAVGCAGSGPRPPSELDRPAFLDMEQAAVKVSLANLRTFPWIAAREDDRTPQAPRRPFLDLRGATLSARRGGRILPPRLEVVRLNTLRYNCNAAGRIGRRNSSSRAYRDNIASRRRPGRLLLRRRRRPPRPRRSRCREGLNRPAHPRPRQCAAPVAPAGDRMIISRRGPQPPSARLLTAAAEINRCFIWLVLHNWRPLPPSRLLNSNFVPAGPLTVLKMEWTRCKDGAEEVTPSCSSIRVNPAILSPPILATVAADVVAVMRLAVLVDVEQ